MATDVMTRKASSAIDDDLAALKEELAQAKRRRVSQRRAGASADVQSQSVGSVTPPIAAQPDFGQSVQPAQSQEEMQQKALISLVRTLGATDPEFFDKFAKIMSDGRASDFRKNLITSIILSTIFLIAGWLLSSAASPATLIALINH